MRETKVGKSMRCRRPRVRWRHPTHDDRGVTLVELMIVMVMMALLAGVLGGSLILLTKTEKKAPDKFEESGSAQGLSTWLSADVQSAQLITSSPDTLNPARPLNAPDACTTTPPAQSANVLHLTWSEPFPGTGLNYVAQYRYEQAGTGEWLLVRYFCSVGQPATSIVVSGRLAAPPPGWMANSVTPAAQAAALPDAVTSPPDGFRLTLTSDRNFTFSVDATRVNEPTSLCSIDTTNPLIVSPRITTGSPPGTFTIAGPVGALDGQPLAGGAVVTVQANVTGPACNSLTLAYTTGTLTGIGEIPMTLSGSVASATVPNLTWLPGVRTLSVRNNLQTLGTVDATIVGCQLNVSAVPSPVALYNGTTSRAIDVTATPVNPALCKTPLDVTVQTQAVGPVVISSPMDAPVSPSPSWTWTLQQEEPFDLGNAQFRVNQRDSLDATRFSANVTVNNGAAPPCAVTSLTFPPAINLENPDLMPPGQTVAVTTEASCQIPFLRYKQGPEAGPFTDVQMVGSRGVYTFDLPAGAVWVPGMKSIQITDWRGTNAGGTSSAQIDVRPYTPPPACTGLITTWPTQISLLPGNRMPAGQTVTSDAFGCGFPRIRFQRITTAPSTPVELGAMTGADGAWSYTFTANEVWEGNLAAQIELLDGSGNVLDTRTIDIVPYPACNAINVSFEQKGANNAPGNFAPVNPATGWLRLRPQGGNQEIDGDIRIRVLVNNVALCGGNFTMNWDVAPRNWTGTGSLSGSTYTFTVNLENGTRWSIPNGPPFPTTIRRYTFNNAPESSTIEARMP